MFVVEAEGLGRRFDAGARADAELAVDLGRVAHGDTSSPMSSTIPTRTTSASNRGRIVDCPYPVVVSSQLNRSALMSRARSGHRCEREVIQLNHGQIAVSGAPQPW